MMTQADILAQNEDTFADINLFGKKGRSELIASYDNRAFEDTVHIGEPAVVPTSGVSSYASVQKPTRFDTDFPSLDRSVLTEQSPIKPSKYLADDSAINTSKSLRNIIVCGLIFSLVITVALMVQILLGTEQVPYRIGIVTPEKVCSDIGASMINMGGNSVDAFIASSLCLSVVNPFSSGIGAGGFLLVRDHKRDKNVAYNCFFKSSATLDPADYNSKPATDSKMKVAVPGELKCLQVAYHHHASFYWKKLASPAINLARNGFVVSPLLAKRLKEIEDVIMSDPIMTEIFVQNDQLVNESSIVRNPRLANTLEMLPRDENILYDNSEVGADMITMLTGEKQYITFNDLSNYNVREEVPTMTTYNDFALITSSSPSSGPILKFMVDLLQTFNYKKSDMLSTELFANLLKVSKMATSMSSLISDPHFDFNQTTMLQQKLELAENYFAKNLTYPFDDVNMNDMLMNNFVSVNDHNDIMVSYVGTLGSNWGSQLITKGGFFLNNGLDLFSYNDQTSVANTIDRNKQPRGLITPILAYNMKNPCIRRFSVSYSQNEIVNDDFGLSELAQVVIRLLTDFSFYETDVDEKRVQYVNGSNFCQEDGFNQSITAPLLSNLNLVTGCQFHSIDLVMKKDHIVYGKADTTRSQDALVLLN